MPTKSSYEALFGPQVRVRAVDRVQSGSPGKFSLRPETGFRKTVSVARSLARRGVPLSVAKHAVERLLAGHAAAVQVPHVESRESFESELAELGVRTDEIRDVAG